MKQLYVVKITIHNRYSTAKAVVYFRSKMKLGHIYNWKWYFEYLVARIKVANPRDKVVLHIGPSASLLGADYVESKTKSLLKAKRSRLKRIESEPVVDDLFSVDVKKKGERIEALKRSIAELENGIFNYYVPPESINRVKEFLTKTE